MKLLIVSLLIAATVIVECSHTFMGTSVQRKMAFHKTVKYSAYLFQKRIEYLNVSIPHNRLQDGRYITGILAYDLTKSGASTNVTAGGLGYTFVNLRMKSDRGKELRYDIYVYI
ncbi:unnamed protein product [Parnassius apollo]|uniref:(apollo) hypothetical protein n=1 Tax=Parnassius apollo TaxID=110799 RepID=A0A8S3YFJ5_PARAO|nr:unnamed protein product [Parnassius apollo]